MSAAGIIYLACLFLKPKQTIGFTAVCIPLLAIFYLVFFGAILRPGG